MTAIRKRRGLSLRAVARSTGISLTMLQRIEQGWDPRLSTAMTLMEFFHVDMRHLWR